MPWLTVAVLFEPDWVTLDVLPFEYWLTVALLFKVPISVTVDELLLPDCKTETESPLVDVDSVTIDLLPLPDCVELSVLFDPSCATYEMLLSPVCCTNT